MASETKAQRSGDDGVVLQPEDYRVLIDVQSSESACAGAAAAFLLRAIAYRAGCYAPGIQEVLFFELQATMNGDTLEAVSRWFGSRSGELNVLGYRVLARRVTYRTDGILSWVSEGKGYRGAVLATDPGKLHGAAASDQPHAVAVALDRDALVQVDPWPGQAPVAAKAAQGKPRSGRSPIAASLDTAHRDRKYAALILYWVGYG